MSPLYTADLFPPLYGELEALLGGLAPDDWERPTLAGAWRVRDVVAHLLDGDLRKLSAYRDGHLPPPPAPIRSYGELVGFLDALNAEWVGAARRLSPRLLAELLAFTGPRVCEVVAALPPHERSLFSVDWAGEAESENWLDTGREYTERWHHQMQIRDAVGAPGLLERRWLHPLLDLSFRALPHAYRAADAPPGTAGAVTVSGEAGGTWSLVREEARWRLHRGRAPAAAAGVTLDPDSAWRLLYNALPAAEARRRARVEGDASLAEPLFAARSVMVQAGGAPEARPSGDR
ncbi:MAG TPA: maleylpyruvate isomerase N-terminal domain-containing protein [Longimicrobium sp.]|nr:maleylpyruvate isomerase N-terminal domain-containing protein [Longimicrobium sp.]